MSAQQKRVQRIKLRRSKLRRGRLKDPPYLAWCAIQPCCVTGELPATTHHIREYGSPKNDHRVIRLVARLHLHEAGMDSIERIGKRAFERKFGIDIKRKTDELYARYQAG